MDYTVAVKKSSHCIALGCSAFALRSLTKVFALHLHAFLALSVYKTLKEYWALTNRSIKHRIQTRDGLCIRLAII